MNIELIQQAWIERDILTPNNAPKPLLETLMRCWML